MEQLLSEKHPLRATKALKDPSGKQRRLSPRAAYPHSALKSAFKSRLECFKVYLEALCQYGIDSQQFGRGIRKVLKLQQEIRLMCVKSSWGHALLSTLLYSTRGHSGEHIPS